MGIMRNPPKKAVGDGKNQSGWHGSSVRIPRKRFDLIDYGRTEGVEAHPPVRIFYAHIEGDAGRCRIAKQNVCL